MDDVMADPVVENYLRRLDEAARALPDDRRHELVDEIAAHIAESRATDAGEAELRTLLDRLGDPEEIVAAARDEEPLTPPGVAPPYGAVEPGARQLRAPGIGLEITAVILMTVGSAVPLVLWLVGVVLLWSSRRWRTWEKIVATLVVPGGPLAVLYLAVFLPTQVSECSGGVTPAGASGPDAVAKTVETHCTTTGYALPAGLGVFLVILWLVAPIVIGVALIARARARAATEPPVEVWRSPSGGSRWGALEIAAVALLAGGGFIVPVIGPIAGLVCVWISSAWTTTEKWIATALTLIPVVLGVLALLAVFAV